MASDGKWYPPRWEYTWLRTWCKGDDPGKAMMEAGEKADVLGAKGWEMVNFTVTTTGAEDARYPQYWYVVCFMKRLSAS